MIKRYIHLFFLLVLVLVKRDALQAQDPYYWQLTDEDGLPSMTVYQVTQAQTGLIWIATANGLCSFDGKNIQQYDDSALNDQEILKIQEAPDGKIWGINLSGQLFFLNSLGKLEVVEYLGGEKLHKVTNFYFFDTKIIIGDIIDIYRGNTLIYDFSIKTIQKLNDKIPFPISCIVRQDSNLVIETRGPNTAFIYKFSLNNSSLVECLKISNTQSMHFGLYKNQILLPYGKGRIKKMVLDNGTDNGIINLNDITRNIRTINGQVFFILNQGIKKYHENLGNFLLPNKNINDVYLDRENNLFFASNEGVLVVVSEKNNLFNYSNTTSSSSKITAIFKDNKNNIYIGNSDGSYRPYERTGFGNSIDLGIKGRVLFIDKVDENIIYGGDSGIRDKLNLMPTATIGAKCFFYSSSKKKMYYGASNAFGCIENKKFKPFVLLRTYAIAETADGIIWIGSDKGIYRYDGVEVKPFRDEKEQMPYRVSAMKIDSENRLWVTTTSHGVVVIKDNKTEKTLNHTNGFPTNTFNCVYIENKTVWLGSDKGVIRYNPATGEKLLINKYYGLPSDEILSLCTDKENLLIGTAKGLITMPFDAMKPNTVAPNIHLLQVKTNEIERNIADKTLNLSYKENNILIEYVSYQYRSRGNARYEYRIMELDTNWTMTDQRSLRFPNLSAGDYHFELRAINECDIRSDKMINLYFQIARPYWLQWWFIASIMGLIGFGVWAVSYQRFRRLQQQQEQEHDFKTKINDLRVQALQAQMNPHFIFNALNAIQHFLTINDDDNAILFLSKFARLIRMVFEYSKKKEITFAQEIEMLEVYLSLEKLRFKDKVSIHFNIPETIEKQKENIYLLPLLIQPIIENSFKHGLFHKKTNGNLYISFDLEENKYLKCVIEDDGIGRNQSAEYTAWRKQQKHTSSGLAATEERLKFWHEKNNNPIKDYMLIEDLTKNGEANGTRVTIIL